MSGSWYLLREYTVNDPYQGPLSSSHSCFKQWRLCFLWLRTISWQSVPGWIGACMPWCIYCPVMWPIMCKYHLSQEQPYVQGLSCGQPERVSNMNNEFNRVTAVSVGTRGIWLFSVKQQGGGIRKDTFCVQDEVRETGRAQKPGEQLDTKLSPTGSP